ncbi:uncharacterized protein LOC144180274 [Haemaphysalis longicornis]
MRSSRPSFAATAPLVKRIASYAELPSVLLFLFLAAVATVAQPFAVTPPMEYDARPNETTLYEVASAPKTAWQSYAQLVTGMTSTLLSEARHMLHRCKDIRERRWLGAFVRRIAQLTGDVEGNEKTPQRASTVASMVQSSTEGAPNRQRWGLTTGQTSPHPGLPSSVQEARTITKGSVQQQVSRLRTSDPELVFFRRDKGDVFTRQLSTLERVARPETAAARATTTNGMVAKIHRHQ